MNKQGEAVDQLRSYQERCVVRNGANTEDVGIGLKDPIVVGKFLEMERPSFVDYTTAVGQKALAGSKRS